MCQWKGESWDGGYGDPMERDPAAVLADVLDGKIVNAAEYGVVLTADGRAVDEVKTKEGREGLAARRTTPRRSQSDRRRPHQVVP